MSPFHCPRGPAPGGPFKPPFDGSAHWREDGTCSYCGSASPEAFFAAVEAGYEVTPTDKSYKVYIDLPETLDPEELVVCGSSNGLERPGDKWVPASEVDEATFLRSNWTPRKDGWLLLEKRGATKHGKFYFQHLDEAGMNRFIELYNAKKIKLAYPGYFYVRPYFCAPVEG